MTPGADNAEQDFVDEFHPFLTPERIERAGAIAAPLLLSDLSWIERRKEVVDILDDTALRRQISVDFSLRKEVEPLLVADEETGADALFCAPVFVLPKSPANLMDFDLSDETGRSLRLQSRADNAKISEAAIIHCARQILGETVALEEVLKEQLAKVARADAPTGKELADDLLNGPAQDPASQLERLRADARFRQWLRTFGHSSLCVVLYRAPRHSRKLLRLSFVAPITTDQPWLAKLGWIPYRLVLDVPLLEARTFHFEARSPTGLRIKEAVLSDSERDQTVRERGLLRRAHLYRDQAQQAGAGSAVIWLAVGGPGFLGGAVLASSLTVLALTACAVWADKIAANPTSAPSLLLILPGLIASYIARPDQHALTSRLLAGARYLLMVAAGCAYVAAGWVALGGIVPPEDVADRESDLLVVLAPLAVLATLVTAGLVLTRARADDQVRRLKDWVHRRREWRVDEIREIAETPNGLRQALLSSGGTIAPPGYRLIPEIGEKEGPVRFVRQRLLGSWFATYELREIRDGCRVTASCDYVSRFRHFGWILRRKTRRRELRESVGRLDAAISERDGGATSAAASPRSGAG